MVKRSLRASPAGIQRAKRAFALKGWTQDNLAGEVNLKTRQPIWRFFTGQPVDRQVFMGICQILDLDWREIAINPPADFLEPGEAVESASISIDELVQRIRSQYQETIQHQCGVLQLVDINHPVDIDDIYVDVNILETVTNQQWLEIANLNNLELATFNRVNLGAVEVSQMSGLQAVKTYPKLRVLGQPGVGKTMFLKYLAVQCNRGEFAAEQVPIFIALGELAKVSGAENDVSLFNIIHQTLLSTGLANPTVLETLLNEGRVLVLLDGLDEVLNRDITAVMREIRRFSGKYYRNQFVISCRTAAGNLCLRGFTDVEIAPFTPAQIISFTQKWFLALGRRVISKQTQTAQFIQKLELPENWQLRQLMVTPLFLHLACWAFQGKEKLSSQRIAFYKQGLNLLLSRWDEARGVARDDVYQGFLLPQKIRLLNYLAAVTFEQGQYFFKHCTIEQYIEDYLNKQPETTLEPEELQLQSEAILKAIVAQHGLLTERAQGIFSFSYLVFHEYLTAREIVSIHNGKTLDQSLANLVSHITDSRWREVFLLTAAMLRSADSLVLIMKQAIDALVAQDSYLKDFLMWASQTVQPFAEKPELAINQAFYLAQSPHTVWQHQLKDTLTDYYNTHFSWQFTLDQQQVLNRYYNASQLLVDCLHSSSNVTEAIRQEIKATLLLPQKGWADQEWQIGKCLA